MATKDLTYGQRALQRLLTRLKQPESLERKYAELILQQARENAASKPTPQARMAAENLSVEGSSIGPSAGGPPAEVAIGSEFGSMIYPQFHRPPNPRGYWLYPATEDSVVLGMMDKELERILDGIVRSPIA